MKDYRRIVDAWAYREGTRDVEITLEADSGESAQERVRAGHEPRYVLTLVEWSTGRECYSSEILGQDEGPTGYARLRELGAWTHLCISRGVPVSSRGARITPQGSPPAAVEPRSLPAAEAPAGEPHVPGLPDWRDHQREAVDRLCQADKGGAR